MINSVLVPRDLQTICCISHDTKQLKRQWKMLHSDTWVMRPIIYSTAPLCMLCTFALPLK